MFKANGGTTMNVSIAKFCHLKLINKMTLYIRMPRLFIWSMLLFACGSSPTSISETTLDAELGAGGLPDDTTRPAIFKDPHFEQFVRKLIDKPAGSIYVADLEHVTSFNIGDSDLSDLTGISNFRNLTHLGIYRTKLSNANDVRLLKKIEQIFAEENSLADLSQFSGIKTLKHLRFRKNQITDINLSDLPLLEELWITEENIQTITALNGLPKLLKVNIEKTGIKELSFFLKFPELTWFKINNNNIQDISAFKDFEALKINRLDAFSNLITDMSPLENLPLLESLFLGQNQIQEIRLPYLQSMYQLNLSNNQITKLILPDSFTRFGSLQLANNQITEISDAFKLEFCGDLDLRNNQITDMGPLANIENFGTFLLSNNQITQLKLTQSMNRIGTLYLSNNQLSDISSFPKLEFCERLDLSNNQIVDISALGKVKEFNYLSLRNNNITDPMALVGRVTEHTYYPNERSPLTIYGELDLRQNPISSDVLAKFREETNTRGASFTLLVD